MQYGNNYFDNKNKKFKTTFQVVLIYIIIGSVVALIVNWSEVLTFIKSLF